MRKPIITPDMYTYRVYHKENFLGYAYAVSEDAAKRSARVSGVALHFNDLPESEIKIKKVN